MREAHIREILKRLLDGKTVTPKTAYEEFGCYRLGARIFDLRKRGYDITTKIHPIKRHGIYSMTPKAIEKARKLNGVAA